MALARALPKPASYWRLVRAPRYSVTFALPLLVVYEPLAALAPRMHGGTPIERMGWWTRAMLSIGAGLYEELLFRVLLVGSLAWLGRAALGMRAWSAGALATLVGAAVFSAFHYVGAYGDPFTLQSF